MASLRNLKKDINYIVGELFCDVESYMDLNPNSAEAEHIFGDIYTFWDEIYDRANKPDGKHDKKLVKQHYASVHKDLEEKSNALFEKISALHK